MRLLKITTLLSLTLLMIISFQNCSQSNFAGVQGVEATKINANDFNQVSDVHTADEITSVNPDPLYVGANECLAAGHVFTTNQGQPKISYRKCDGEIEQWRNYGKAACCSGQVSITDTQVFSDNKCSDGLYAGVMTCL